MLQFTTMFDRNIKYRKEAAELGGSSENLELEEVEMDTHDLPVSSVCFDVMLCHFTSASLCLLASL